jgi:AraC family transcriptional regulator, ethanolamine operon transcriptional activator
MGTMTEPPPTSLGKPFAKVLPLNDFDQGKRFFSDWQGQIEQISSGKFEGRIEVVRNSLVRIVQVVSNQRVLARGHDASGLLSVYPVTSENAGDLWQGYRLSPGHLILNGVQTEIDHCVGRGTKSTGLSLKPQKLHDAARIVLGTDGLAIPSSWFSLMPPPDIMARLNANLGRLLDIGVETPTLLGNAECGQIEQECIRALVSAIFPVDSRRVEPPLPARTQIVRCAVDFLRANLNEPVGAVDLCKELKVSDRTLRLAFRERFGLGPMTYYRCLRLNVVRMRLREHPEWTIAQAAASCGFHHLGNFAADYRRLFGELPTATARFTAPSPEESDELSL